MSDGAADRFGPYRTAEMLGRGGMGVVFRAENLDTGTEVALKAFVDPLDPSLAQALRREVATLESLDHPNVVSILDHDVDASPPWYAMELVRGRSLASWLRRPPADDSDTVVDVPGPTLLSAGAETGALVERPTPEWDATTRTALSWLGQIAHALAFMHGLGLVHGDLKPANIVISGERAVLVDFGLAARIETRVSAEALARATSSGHTPAYTAPERFRRERLDPRTDLYALGCIMFEMIAGCRPFDGSMAEVIHGHLHGAPPFERIADAAPIALRTLVRRLLEKHPSERLANAVHVVATLEDLGIATTTADTRPPKPTPYLYPPPTVGRDRELRRLDECLKTASTGDGTSAVLLGSAGAGKSTVAMELIRQARTRKFSVVITEGRHSTALSDSPGQPKPPFEACQRLFRTLIEELNSIPPQEASRVAGPDATYLARFDERFETWAGAPPTMGDLVFAAARSAVAIMERLYEDRKMLFVFEDLQWFDSASEQVFEVMARLAPERAWMILGMARSTELDPGSHERITDVCGRVLELAPLSVADTAAAVQGMLGGTAVDEEIAELLRARSSGNAYYVSELLHVALAHGLLSQDRRGRWRGGGGETLAAALSTLPEPESLSEITQRRIASLSPDLLRVARHAAVLGHEVEFDILVTCLRRSAIAVYGDVGRLIRRGIFDRDASARGVRFVHELTREALYGSIAADERREMHATTAAVFEATSAPAGMIAWHLERAGLDAEAAPYWVRAADMAFEQDAYREAADRYGDALRTASLTGGEEGSPNGAHASTILDRMSVLARRLRALNRAAGHALVIEEASDVFDALRTSASAVTILAECATAHRRLGEPKRALEAALRAVETARKADEPGPLTEALIALGDARHENGANEDARACYDEALTLCADHQLLKLQAKAESAMATLRYAVTDYEGSLEWFNRALETLTKVNDLGQKIDTLMNLGSLHTELGNLDEAERWYLQAYEIAEEIADTNRLAWLNMNLGAAYSRRNEYDRAREAFQKSLRHHRQSGSKAQIANCLVNLGADAVDQGAFEIATLRFREALELSQGAEYRRGEAYALISLGECYVQSGRLERGHELMKEGLSVGEELGDRYIEASVCCRLGSSAAQAGRPDEAAEYSRRATALADELQSPSVSADALFTEGVVERVRGAPGVSLRKLESAFDLLSNQGRAWWAALAACECAASAEAAGEDPAKWIDRARDVVDSLALTERSLPSRTLRALETATEAAPRDGPTNSSE